ncbi:MAG: glycosyltransferase [Phycisphaeraceae bacterium]|nr:glycosyltransferase [Phycisphaeraceae bacterium]
MKVVSIGTYDRLGGAARAAFRQHEALRLAGVDHWMLVGKKSSRDPFVVEAPPMRQSYIRSRKAELIRQFGIDRNRTPLSDTWFSFPLRDNGLAALDILRSADIINVHWCSALLSLTGLDELCALGKPIVLTLHDQWAFTGGCHYSAGCEGFRKDCSSCPQLAVDPFHVPATVLRLRQELTRARRGTVVSPSRWMCRTACESPVLAGWRHEHIPMPLDMEAFKPQPRETALAHLGLKPGPWRILFVADRVAERRKGFQDLVEAAALVTSVADRPVHFLAMGQHSELSSELAPRVEFVGSLSDDEKIAATYSASDCLLLPSHEDNLPNTMTEALACGTPVVGYDIGGLPDLIRPGESGTLVPKGDIQSLAQALINLLSSGETESLRPACRRIAEENCSYPGHARRCIDLYENLLATHTPATSPPVDYDARLWDESIKLLLHRLELRSEFSETDKQTIIAGRLEIARLFYPNGAAPLPNRWIWI